MLAHLRLCCSLIYRGFCVISIQCMHMIYVCIMGNQQMSSNNYNACDLVANHPDQIMIIALDNEQINNRVIVFYCILFVIMYIIATGDEN